MSAETDALAIEVTELTKVFRVFDHPSDIVRDLISRTPRHREVCALDGISLSARPGETVGIVGRNGAGKTTLLSIIAGTVNATSGQIRVNGRIGAILELGTGFHPGFTGRENVYMGGLCMGLTRQDMDDRFGWIVEFSELADVMDQPLFTYSTGMKARLFFSTALSVDPDVLIVDEALSVGDARFQVKSFRRFQELKERGVTILLVSHNANTVTQFCDRAIILEGGRVYGEGDPSTMMQIYHRLMFGDRTGEAESSAPASPVADAGEDQSAQGEHRYGTGEITITHVELRDRDGRSTVLLESGEPYSAVFVLKGNETLDDVCAGFVVGSDQGVVLFGTDTNYGRMTPLIAGIAQGQELRVVVDFTAWLGPGTYFVTVAVARSADQHKYDCRHDALQITVTTKSDIYAVSKVNLDAQFRIEDASTSAAGSESEVAVAPVAGR